jgi:hypothetical protein
VHLYDNNQKSLLWCLRDTIIIGLLLLLAPTCQDATSSKTIACSDRVDLTDYKDKNQNSYKL